MTTDCGTVRGYRQHITDGTPKCARCTRANSRSAKAWRIANHAGGPRLVDATGTRRRLQALARMGWSWADIGARFGVHNNAVQQWATRPRVNRATADRVTDLYRELDGQTGPAPRAAARAAGYGWAPPIAWDDDTIDDPTAAPFAGEQVDVDEVAVQRALSGRPVQLSRADRVELTRRLTAAGRSAAEIAEVLGVEPRSVVRYRAAA